MNCLLNALSTAPGSGSIYSHQSRSIIFLDRLARCVGSSGGAGSSPGPAKFGIACCRWALPTRPRGGEMAMGTSDGPGVFVYSILFANNADCDYLRCLSAMNRLAPSFMASLIMGAFFDRRGRNLWTEDWRATGGHDGEMTEAARKYSMSGVRSASASRLMCRRSSRKDAPLTLADRLGVDRELPTAGAGTNLERGQTVMRVPW